MTIRRALLPSELPDEATTITASDWQIVQVNGETKLRRIRPGVLPAKSIGAAEIDDKAVTRTQIADNTIQVGQLADNAVETAKAYEAQGADELTCLDITASHEAHAAVLKWAAGRSLALSGHVVAETYSVLTTVPANTSHKKMALVALLNQSWWVLGTLIGAVVGAQAQITLAGLDFVLASLFAVLTVEQWRTKKSPAPLWVALAAYAVAYPLAAKHALVIAIALSIAAGMLWKSKSTRAGEHA